MNEDTKPQFLGRYIVAHPGICHGKPTFRGTRIMVTQVLQMLADGLSFEEIVMQCHDSIPKAAVSEAILLANKTFVAHAREYGQESPA